MTSIELTILGTQAMVPTEERNVQAFFLSFRTHGFLFDCGEGTQRQMQRVGISREKITKIFITHWHGDHMGGLLPLFQTLSHKEPGQEIHIELYGPKGTKTHLKHLLEASCAQYQLQLTVFEHDLTRKKNLITVYEDEWCMVLTAGLRHSAPCNGYVFVEKDRYTINTSYLRKLGVPDGPHLQKLQKGHSFVYNTIDVDVQEATTLVKGKRIAFVGDTAPCENAVLLAQDADVLIIEATYREEHADKAEENDHLTAAQAAQIAQAANAHRAYLTHFSKRYPTLEGHKEEAAIHFPKVELAHDLQKIKL